MEELIFGILRYFDQNCYSSFRGTFSIKGRKLEAPPFLDLINALKTLTALYKPRAYRRQFAVY